MRISVFGIGYVGAVSGACLARTGHQVMAVDTNEQKVDMINSGLSPIVEEGLQDLIRETVGSGALSATTDAGKAIRETDVSFISVGTPSTPNGSLSLDAVLRVSAEIGDLLREKRKPHTVVVRSTVLPGTTDREIVPVLAEHSGKEIGGGLEVCYNPEFLREGSSIQDFTSPPYTIVGASSEKGFRLLETVYEQIRAPFVRTSFRSAEAIKYLSNMYHALKICFANEIGAVLKEIGVDAREAMEIFCRDTVLNISNAYLRPGYAFGGSCLPKDMRAFLHLAKRLDVELPMLNQVLASNQCHIERAYRMIASMGRRKVALLGLSFKVGTDDLRESPIVTLAERLIGRGFELKIFDPFVHTAKLMGSNKQYIDKEIPHLERLMVPDVRSALEGAEVLVIGHVGPAEIRDIVACTNGEIATVDLQGVKEIKGWARDYYRGICW